MKTRVRDSEIRRGTGRRPPVLRRALAVPRREGAELPLQPARRAAAPAAVTDTLRNGTRCFRGAWLTLIPVLPSGVRVVAARSVLPGRGGDLPAGRPGFPSSPARDVLVGQADSGGI